VIARWWRRWPCANVGIATGPRSGIVVLDVDPRHAGDVTLAQHERSLGALPDTVVAETGGGGWHVYFIAPDDALVGAFPPGVDVKHVGGYVVAPPSTHWTGGVYRWRAECAPDEIEVAPLPGRWLTALRRSSAPVATFGPNRVCHVPIAQRVRRARAYVDRMPPAVSGQGGHRATWAVAVVLVRGFALEAEDAIPILRAYSARCLPPWSERELAHKLEDAQHANMPWGMLLDRCGKAVRHVA
jgi:hypothetical protein